MKQKSGPEIHFEGEFEAFRLRLAHSKTKPRDEWAQMTQGEAPGEESLLAAPEVQRTLIKLYEGENVEFKATIVHNDSIEYQELEKLAQVDSYRARQILDLLEGEGILAKEPYEFFFACPNCNSKDLVLRIRCPACKGEAFKVGTALEHLNCGHADLEDAFVTSNGFRCPNCKKGLKTLGVDYRRFNNYYGCINCGRLSGIVEDLLLCNKCGRKLPVEEARHGVLSTYRYIPESRTKVESRLWPLYEMRAKLAAHHYIAKFGGFASGKSGVQHHFDILVWPDDEPHGAQQPSIVVDILPGNRESIEGHIATSVAKALDVGCPNTLVMVVPQATREWTKMASFYGITIIECPSMSEVASRLEPAVMGVISSTSMRKLREPSMSEGKPEPSAPTQRFSAKGEDAVILKAIIEKQEELSRLIQWFMVKSNLLEGQSAGPRQGTKELGR